MDQEGSNLQQFLSAEEGDLEAFQSADNEKQAVSSDTDNSNAATALVHMLESASGPVASTDITLPLSVQGLTQTAQIPLQQTYSTGEQNAVLTFPDGVPTAVPVNVSTASEYEKAVASLLQGLAAQQPQLDQQTHSAGLPAEIAVPASNQADTAPRMEFLGDINGSTQIVTGDGTVYLTGLPGNYILSSVPHAQNPDAAVTVPSADAAITPPENDIHSQIESLNAGESESAVVIEEDDTNTPLDIKIEDLQQSQLPPKKIKVFSSVTATLSPEILQAIPGDQASFLRTLAERWGLSMEVTANMDSCQITGELTAIQQVQQSLGQLLELIPPTKSEKGVSCSLLQPVITRSGRQVKVRNFETENQDDVDNEDDVYVSPKPRYLNQPRKRRKPGRPRKYFTSPGDKDGKNAVMIMEVNGGDVGDTSNDHGANMAEKENIQLTSVKTEPREETSEALESDELEKALEERRLKHREREKMTPFKYFCDKCSYKTKRQSHFENHMKKHSDVTSLLHCKSCEFTTLSQIHLRRHQILKHSNRLWLCSMCEYKTDNQALLKRHISSKHRAAVKKPQDLSEIKKCTICMYQTRREHLFQRHMRCHANVMVDANETEVAQVPADGTMVEEYQCNSCDYNTTRKERYIRHMMTVHMNKRPFLCDTCGKAFKRQDALKQHRWVHMDKAIKIFQAVCPHCSKKFRTQAHMREHLRIHSTKREFLCEHCGAAFKTMSSQRKHIQSIHSNPRAYPCPDCQKRFNTKYALCRHARTHKNKKQSIMSIDPIEVAPVRGQRVEVVHLPTQEVTLADLHGQKAETEQLDTQTAANVIAQVGSEVAHGAAGVAAFETDGEIVSSEIVQQLQQQQTTATLIQTNEATTAVLYITPSNFQTY